MTIRSLCWLIVALTVMFGSGSAQDCSCLQFPNWSVENRRYTNPNNIEIDFDGVITKLKMENVEGIRTTNKEYIDANFDLDNQILSVHTTEEYKKYYENAISTSIDLIIIFTCNDKIDKELRFVQKIDDSNVFKPKFSQDIYDFKIPLPLRRGTDLTIFQEISAIDYDIVYNEVTFSSNNSQLVRVKNSDKTGEKKRYFASLILDKDLSSIDEDIKFTIYAKDNGRPIPFESSAQIIISANIAESLPPQPRFREILYNGQLNDNYELSINDTIELYIGTYSENVTFMKTGNDESLFQIIPEHNFVQIELAHPITPDDLINKTYLQIEIIAANSKLNETGRTAVIVTFPIPLAKLHFEKSIYYGKINNENKLELEDAKIMGQIDDPEKIKFILSGNDVEYFNFNVSDGNLLKLQLKENVNSSELNERNFLSVHVQAELNNFNITSTAIVIDIVKETDVFFSKSMYQGEFSDFNNFTIENIEILESSYTETITFLLEGNDSKYFNYTKQENKIKINFIESIYPEEWKLKKFLTFFIKAKKSKVSDQTAGILIRLVDQKLEIPEFEKSLYLGNITANDRIEIEMIKLKNSVENIEYILAGNEKDYFNYDVNESEIYLNSTLPNEILQNKTFLSLTIIAKTENATKSFATIILETPEKSQDITLNFSKTLYKGSLDKHLNLSVEAIKFENNLQVNDIYLVGPDANFFNVSVNQSNVIFQLKANLTENDIKERKYFDCLIIAKSTTNTESGAAILIDIPKKDIAEIPKFNKNIYNGKIISNVKIELELITLKFPIKNIEFEINGDLKNYFETQSNDSHISVYVSNPIPDSILQSSSYISFVLVAKAKDQLDSNFTTIILKTPEKSLSKPLEFTKILYKGQIMENLKLTIEEIKFRNVITLKHIYIEGEDEKYFIVTAEDLTVSFQLKADLNESDIRDRKYFECTIVAETENGVFSRTVVIIDIIIDSTTTIPPTITTIPPTTTTIPPNTTTIPPTTTPDTTADPITTTQEPPSSTSDPITTTPNLPPETEFEKALYVFTVMPNKLEPFGVVNIKQSDNIQVEYKLENINEHANSRITINKQTGELSLTSEINPGVYNFEATAKTNVSSHLARTKIQVRVNSISVCDENTKVQNSLLIKNLQEEKIHYDILQMKQDNCQFEILDMEPNDQKYFQFNESTNMLNSIAIDREAEIFSNLHIVQIQLKLVLKTIPTNEYEIPTNYFRHNQFPTNQLQSFSKSTNERQYILTNDIIFDPAVTILSVIIDDINDNKPEFINPSKSEIIIGYPDTELSDKTLPEYLIKVYAVDKDIGINAAIRYRISPTSNDFGIDEKTGIIYPFSSALKNVDETMFNVYAIDRDGGQDGLNSSIKIIVKKLNPHNLVLFTFESAERVEINKILRNISTQIGLNLMNLNDAIVPSEGRFYNFKIFDMFLSRVSDKKTIISKTWIYSLDENNLPLDAGVLKKKISNGYQNSDVKVERYEDSRNNISGLDTTGYIVAISLLSVICIGLIGFLAWIYYFRPMIYKRLSSPSLDKLPPFNSVNSLDPNSVYQNQVEKCDSPLSSYLKRESVKIFGSTTQETSSDDQQHSRNADNNEDISDTESNSNDISDASLEKRKSIVTFNELVERIDIESDDEDRKDSFSSSIRL